MQTASKIIQVFISSLFGARSALYARLDANAYSFAKKHKINILKIWGESPFHYRRAHVPYCAPECKAIKSWMILDAVCTLNYEKSTKTRDNSSNFPSSAWKLFFESRFFDHKNQKFSRWKLHALKVLKFHWNSLLFLLFFKRHECAQVRAKKASTSKICTNVIKLPKNKHRSL